MSLFSSLAILFFKLPILVKPVFVNPARKMRIQNHPAEDPVVPAAEVVKKFSGRPVRQVAIVAVNQQKELFRLVFVQPFYRAWHNIMKRSEIFRVVVRLKPAV
ncbi:MAG: hypothetical protein ABIG11_09545 [bacterium]